VKYVARRLLHGAALLAAVSLLSFVLAQIAPGDFYAQLRSDPRLSPETIAALRAQAGIDRPLPLRYVAWVAGVVRGDFGYSLAYRGPVAALLKDRIGATLLLTATSTFFAWLVAVPLGIWSAARRGKWGDRAATFAVSILLAIPDLLLAIALLLLAVRTGWFPAGGKMSRGYSEMSSVQQWRDVAWHLVLPAMVLVAGLTPALIRHVRAAMLEVMDAPFALSARAQGIPRRRLWFRHLLPAALNPLISLFGFSLGTLLSASLLVEVVMGWPGVGPLFLEAIMARDFPVVLAVVMLSTLFLLAGNLVADLLLYRADPRIRTVDG
jgi:peptide/nickel transport system permease protein